MFQCDESYIHFGNIVVGTQSTKELVIFNDSSSNLEYKLEVQQEMEGPYPEEQTRNDKLGLFICYTVYIDLSISMIYIYIEWLVVCEVIHKG